MVKTKTHFRSFKKCPKSWWHFIFQNALHDYIYIYFLGYQENKYFKKSMKTYQFLCHAMPSNNRHLASSLGRIVSKTSQPSNVTLHPKT
jgi:hypothetical protein